MRTLIAQVHLAPSSIRIELDPVALSEVIDVKPSSWREYALEVKSAFELRRRGVEIKLMTGSFEPEPDKILVRAIAKAHQWLDEARKGVPLAAIGRRYGWTDSPIRQRIRLAFLSPQITTAILEGRQPPELTLQFLLTNPIPLDWSTQAERLGFNRKTLPAPE